MFTKFYPVIILTPIVLVVVSSFLYNDIYILTMKTAEAMLFTASVISAFTFLVLVITSRKCETISPITKIKLLFRDAVISPFMITILLAYLINNFHLDINSNELLIVDETPSAHASAEFNMLHRNSGNNMIGSFVYIASEKHKLASYISHRYDDDFNYKDHQDRYIQHFSNVALYKQESDLGLIDVYFFCMEHECVIANSVFFNRYDGDFKPGIIQHFMGPFTRYTSITSPIGITPVT